MSSPEKTKTYTSKLVTSSSPAISGPLNFLRLTTSAWLPFLFVKIWAKKSLCVHKIQMFLYTMIIFAKLWLESPSLPLVITLQNF